ncbi:MAG: His/Gly/Thr/Pro-type tRNA ligase C-terminal domain-containing protein, partial [Actinomycetota bacterium]|nr:His/Gly/Thr/Pro-type tRNA ligase C-terminal domain-containing protein [Actinomycetota bacterium]
VAPYQVHLVAISHLRDPEVARISEELYSSLGAAGIEVLFDDRDLAPGVKLNDADLMGIPVQLVIGPKGIASGVVELKRRKDQGRREVTVLDAESAVISLVAELFAEL